ncbi:MAG: sugar ABC transporter permease [Oscillospiraceae bacterium]|nr:sugar ABC transporter permease [Oscillospiraceae bacterium]
MRMKNKEALAGYMFALPWILGFLFFTLIPITQSIIYSFMDYNILQPPKWVGFDNYRNMVNDRIFWKALSNTLYYVAFSVPLTMLVGLVIAMLLNNDISGIAVYRTLYYMPSIVPVVASTILWLWIFNPNFGILTTIVRMFGVKSPAWLADPQWSKRSLVIMALWSAGRGMIIYVAGLKNISRVYYEAAEIDGASRLKRLVWITIPLLTPTLFFQLVMGIIDSFQVFTQAFIMTAGGPNDSTLFYVLYLYNNAFSFWKMGYASSLAWVLLIIIMVITSINFIVSKYWVQYDQS